MNLESRKGVHWTRKSPEVGGSLLKTNYLQEVQEREDAWKDSFLAAQEGITFPSTRIDRLVVYKDSLHLATANQ